MWLYINNIYTNTVNALSIVLVYTACLHIINTKHHMLPDFSKTFTKLYSIV